MHDVVVLGGGPGGYAAALYAHNFGLKVALIEKERVGGTCLIRGCIPAKTWLQAAEVFQTVKSAGQFGVTDIGEPGFDWHAGLARKNKIVDGLVRGLSGLLKHRGVDVIDGYGRLESPTSIRVSGPEGERVVEGRHLVLATGSVPRSIPGYDIDGVRLVTSDHALDWPERPQRVGIIGAGAIGCEFASLLTDLGSEVHLFELMDQIVPGADETAAKELSKQLRRKGVKQHVGVAVDPPQVHDHGVTLRWKEDESVEVDVVLVAVGRAPVTDDLGLEAVGISSDRGFVTVDPATQQTSVPSVYAVGDIVAGTPQLAHAGFAEAIAAVTHIATREVAPVEYKAIPLVVYTQPEMAEVGLSEARAKEAGLDVEVHSHSFIGVGRAQIIGHNQGVVKVVVEKGGPIVGASVVGPHAGELIHELMYAVGWEALPEEAAAFVHAHPTLSEAVGETLLASTGRSLH
jgi:dihydrolipoamide dehydrogenase